MDAFTGEIRIFAGSYPPRDWEFCDGRELPVREYMALFQIIGNRYGGNGITSFALPNLKGRAPMGKGNGPGLTPRPLGASLGEENVRLRVNQMPFHNHTPMAIDKTGAFDDPADHYWAETKGVGRPPVQAPIYASPIDIPMASDALGTAGGDQGHNNMQPYLALNFIICLQGEFPQRE